MEYSFKNYKIVENYLDRKIEVMVSEWWSCDGIEEATICCSSNPIVRQLGNKNGLTLDYVLGAILNEFEIAEKKMCCEMREHHDGFVSNRNFSVIVEYKEQEICVNLILKAISNKLWVSCDSSAQRKVFLLSDHSYRNTIVDEIGYYKRKIDKEVSSQTGPFGKVKKKIKSLFD